MMAEKETEKFLARAKELLSYNPDTGIFTYLQKAGRRSVGKQAGSISEKGYRAISIDKTRYYAHRLAWLFETGKWPEKTIDHINGSRDDNRIANLRNVSMQENMHNLHGAKSNKHKVSGVHFRKQNNKFVARIRINKKSIHLGSFETAEEAQASYLAAVEKRRIASLGSINPS